jgi:glyoxylase-like metal-dependent hydrolase (beta-lactamase superfamily II)
LLKAAMAAAGLAFGAPILRFSDARAQAAPQSPGTQKLADDLYIVSIPGEANVLAQIDPRGVLLVDGTSAAGSDALMKAVSALSGAGAGPVHTLFNTHWHPEQTGSNERLGKAGATIIAQENTRLWLNQNVDWPYDGGAQKVKKLPKAAQPNKSFYETGKLDSGIQYGYIMWLQQLHDPEPSMQAYA